MISRRDFIHAGCLAGAVSLAPHFLDKARAAIGLHGGSAFNPALSKVQIDISPDAGTYKNLMLGIGALASGSNPFPAYLNADQYPTGTIPWNIGGSLPLPSNLSTSATYVVAWTGVATNGGNGAIYLELGPPGFTVTSDAGGFVIGGTSSNLILEGTNGYVEFSFNSVVTALNTVFAAGTTFTGFAGLILCLKSDYASIIAATNAGQLITSAYIGALTALKPKRLRFIGFQDVNDQNNSTLHKYRLGWKTALCYSNNWIPTCWAGSSSGTNSYTVANATDSPASYTLGEVLQLQFINANTAANPTIARGSLGAVPLLDMLGNPLTSGAIAANALATLIYDDLLGGYLVRFYAYGGLLSNAPVEVQIGICNAVGCDFWYNFAPHVNYKSSVLETSTSVSQIAALISGTLTHNCIFEYGDEIWNFASGFEATTFATLCGAAFGFPNNNNRQFHGYYGYRLAVMWPLVKTAWGARSGLGCANAFQGTGNAGAGGDINVYRLAGADLASVANGGQGNSTWISYTGNANFTAFPNRPVDVSTGLSYATYWYGAQTGQFDPDYTNTGAANLQTGGPASGPGSTLNGLLGAATAFAAGGATNITNAVAWLDWDIRQGTAGGTPGSATLLYFNSGANLGSGAIGVYPSWEAVAHLYDGARPSGAVNLTIDIYEAACAVNAPSTSECTTLGISTSYGGPSGTIQALINYYKTTGTFYATVTQQYANFFAAGATNSRVQVADWFQMSPNDQWSMSIGPDIYGGFYQSYYATAAYN